MGKHKERFEEECRRIDRIHKDAEHMLGMDTQWTIDVVFDPGYDGDTEGSEAGEAATVHPTSAITTTYAHYMVAKIRYFPCTTMHRSDDTVFFIAVHELCHILNNVACRHLPVNKPHITQDEELATERMARAIMVATGRPMA